MMKYLFFLLFTLSLGYSKILIVTNQDTQLEALSQNKIQYLFLGKVSKIDGVNLKPILIKDDKLHEEFLDKGLNKSVKQFKSYWSRLIFTGKRSTFKKIMPNELDTYLDEVNTVTYIEKDQLQPEWKILFEFK